MSDPLVTIVVPSFQQVRFLPSALDSILSQDYGKLEVLVYDGGSTDGTLEVLKGYGDRIWFRSDRDGGQGHAVNEGFERAKGEIVAWLNSDDIYYPGAVSKAVAALQAQPDAGLVYGEGDLVDEGGVLMRRFPETVPFDLWRLANVSDYILQPTVFFRRWVLERYGMLDEGLAWGLDWDLWLRLGRRVPFAHVDEVLAANRTHGATKTATGGFRRLWELYRVLRRHGVRGPSPAAVAHTITTVVRTLRPTQAPVATDDLVASVPRPMRGLVRPLLNGAERRLRRWLQNAQGVWADRLVASAGHIWLPNDGAPGRLCVEGENLDLQDQVVCVRVGGKKSRTDYLTPGESFRLEVDVVAGSTPVKALLSCSRTTRVCALDPKLGRRRAGFRLSRYQLVR